MIRIDREQLAWAAGLFDGEGSIGFYANTTARPLGGVYFSKKVMLQMSQKDPSVLHRFTRVVGLGRVRGPYIEGRKFSIYHYRATRFEHIQAVIAMLWPWLGDVKRAQAARALTAATAWRRRPIPA